MGTLYYATRYGSTGRTAKWIADEISTQKPRIEQLVPGTVLHPDDYYIIGTPVFLGKPPDEVLHFIHEYKEELQKKPLFVFVCSWAEATVYRVECYRFTDFISAQLSPARPEILRSLPGKLLMNEISLKDQAAMKRLLRRIENKSDEFRKTKIDFSDQTSEEQSRKLGSEINHWLNNSNLLSDRGVM